MSEKRFFFNGIDGSTGRYLLPPLRLEEVAALARGDEADEELLQWLKRWNERYAIDDPLRERVFGENAKDITKTGWGVIYAPDTPSGIRRKLQPLLDHRRDQVGWDKKSYVQVFNYKPGQTVREFLSDGGARPDGAADPDRGVPYHLLLVGDPEAIPYRFQYELDVRYSVGRIHFETEDAYENYAANVIAAERRPRRPRKVTFFGPRHRGDLSTESTASKLIELLGRTLIVPPTDWTPEVIAGPKATKAQLSQILAGRATPALLLAACHGVFFPDSEEEKRQLEKQGGLICQDWPGPEDETGVQRDHYFAAGDLMPDADLRGLVAFLFACYSAGTPDRDNFYDGRTLGKPRRLAPRPFVSRLCQALLGRPNGALAVVGHVDRAWTASFQGSDKGEGADNFKNCLRHLLDGYPVGAAMDYFNQAYATLSAQLSNCWEDRHNQARVNPAEFAEIWLANNDARNFVVFGDPAVKLSVPD